MSKIVKVSRRGFMASAGAAGLVAASGIAMPFVSRAASRPAFTHGVQSGDVDGASGMVWTRVDRPSRVLFEVATREDFANATRLDPDHPWARFCDQSLARSTNKKTAVLPSLGGTLPNDVFADDLALPTVWVPHSYRGCSQHAPNEHALASIMREGLQLMTGLFWDLGAGTSP